MVSLNLDNPEHFCVVDDGWIQNFSDPTETNKSLGLKEGILQHPEDICTAKLLTVHPGILPVWQGFSINTISYSTDNTNGVLMFSLTVA